MTTTTAQAPPDTASPSSQERYLISVILDRTGSMSACEAATVSGFNEFLHGQQADPNGQAFLDLTLFDSPADRPDIERRFVARTIAEVPDLGTAANPYQPRGMTPLYDAIGITVQELDKVASEYTRVLVVIQTDGAENASRDWTRERIFDLITHKRAQGWAFIFLGADQNAYVQSQQMGVAAGSVLSYNSASQSAAFAATSGSATHFRATKGATSDTFYQGNALAASISNVDPYGTVVGSGPSTPPVGAPVQPAKQPRRKAPHSDRMDTWRQRQ